MTYHPTDPKLHHDVSAPQSSASRFYTSPYPSGLNEPINRGLSEDEIKRKAHANALWWKKFKELMKGT